MKKTLVASACMVAASNAAFTAVETASLTTTDRGFPIVGGATDDFLGYVVASAGDFNNDNKDDLLITTSVGKAYVVFGKGTTQSKAVYDLGDSTKTTTDFITLSADAADTTVVGALAGDVNKDNVDDLIIGVPGAGTNAGQVYVLYGKANIGDIDLTAVTAATASTGGFKFTNTADKFGSAVAAAGDIDGDDIDDVLISSINANTGTVHVILGKSSATRTTDIDLSTDIVASVDGFTIEAGTTGNFGASFVKIGDVNGDNNDDILIGAPLDNKAYIVYGTATAALADIDLATVADTTYSVITGVASSKFGQAVAEAGDFNNDGKDDLLIAAPEEAVATAGNTEGRVYVVFGRNAASDLADIDVASLGTAGLSITGATTTEKLGWAIAGVEDINDDDVDDIVVSAQGSENVYVLFGKKDIKDNIALSTTLASDVGVTIKAPASGFEFGKSVNAIGDFNGDGVDDFVISSPSYDYKVDDTTTRTEAGAAWVIYGVEEPAGNKSAFRLGAGISMLASFLIALIL